MMLSHLRLRRRVALLAAGVLEGRQRGLELELAMLEPIHHRLQLFQSGLEGEIPSSVWQHPVGR